MRATSQLFSEVVVEGRHQSPGGRCLSRGKEVDVTLRKKGVLLAPVARAQHHRSPADGVAVLGARDQDEAVLPTQGPHLPAVGNLLIVPDDPGAADPAGVHRSRRICRSRERTSSRGAASSRCGTEGDRRCYGRARTKCARTVTQLLVAVAFFMPRMLLVITASVDRTADSPSIPTANGKVSEVDRP